MNCCAKNKRRIAWLAADALAAAEARALRAHLERCLPCQRYWRRMSELSQQLATDAQRLPLAAPAESFHRQLVQRIAAEQREPVLLAITWSFWTRRQVASLFALAAMIMAILLWRQSLPQARPSDARQPRIAVAAETVADAGLPPTLASYRRAASDSLETLDALLTENAARYLSSRETFTLSNWRLQPLDD